MLPDSMNVGVIAENIKKLETMVKEAGSELPTPGAGDTGKILKVGSDGYELATEYSYTPPAYSETETNTGRKWIDGRDVFEKVISSSFPEITSTGTQIIDSTLAGFLIISAQINAQDTSGNYHTPFNIFLHNPNTGNLAITSVGTNYSECAYVVVIRYVKPAPVPSTETKKKTSKKGE